MVSTTSKVVAAVLVMGGLLATQLDLTKVRSLRPNKIKTGTVHVDTLVLTSHSLSSEIGCFRRYSSRERAFQNDRPGLKGGSPIGVGYY
jgi:hypothetical protein